MCIRGLAARSLFTLILGASCVAHAQFDNRPAASAKPLRIGFIGSLSSFAANYGTSVLQGAQLAIDELADVATKIELHVEDDQSVMKNTVNGYVKLKSTAHVDAIIGGSWWANAIVKLAERDGLVLLSCETLFNDDAVLGRTSFILGGDLRRWIQVYEPLIQEKSWKTAAIVRYASGFGATLAQEMAATFDRESRRFAGAIEYNSIEMSEAPSIVLRLKALQPDVVYVDAQPGGLANLLRKLGESQMTELNIITHSAADDLHREQLLDLSRFKNLHYTKRTTFDPQFAEKFRDRYEKPPYLEADLGYYAVYLLADALQTADPVARLKSGITVQGKRFPFDANNVGEGVRQEVFSARDFNS